MKNLLLILLTLTFTISSSAQYAVMSAVDLNEGGEKEYLALEEFFSAINKEAVKQGLQTGQYVYKRTPKEGDEANAPEYFIFNTYSSMEQFQQGINWQELALKVYKGKMSKRAINRMLNNSTYNAEKEQNILAGNSRQWVLVEAIDRSENAYDGWTHMAWNLQAENPGEYNIPSGFEWDKLWEGIQSSRDMTDSTELTCVYSTED